MILQLFMILKFSLKPIDFISSTKFYLEQQIILWQNNKHIGHFFINNLMKIYFQLRIYHIVFDMIFKTIRFPKNCCACYDISSQLSAVELSSYKNTGSFGFFSKRRLSNNLILKGKTNCILMANFGWYGSNHSFLGTARTSEILIVPSEKGTWYTLFFSDSA